MFGGSEKDLESELYKDMKTFKQEYHNIPSGAFFAMAKEMYDWDAEDWGWFAEVAKYDEKRV